MTARETRARARETLGGNIFHTNWLMVLLITLIVNLILSLASSFFGIILLIVGGPITFGLSRTLLVVCRTKECKFDNLFDGFKEDFVGNLLLFLLQNIFIFLWSLLFIIPGIVKTFSYSMSYYIKADHPEYSWKQCIDESRRMMNGHKFRLFCLYLSFIGWIIVGAILCGIGTLWVNAYLQTAKTHFYEDLRERDSATVTE